MKRKSLLKHFQNSKQDADEQAILWLALSVGICHCPQKEQIISLKPTSRGVTNTQQWIYLVGTTVHLAWNDIFNSRQYQTLRSKMNLKWFSPIAPSLLPAVWSPQGEAVTNVQTTCNSCHCISSLDCLILFWSNLCFCFPHPLATNWSNKVWCITAPCSAPCSDGEEDHPGSWWWHSQASFLCPTRKAGGCQMCYAARPKHNLGQFSALLLFDLNHKYPKEIEYYTEHLRSFQRGSIRTCPVSISS